MKTTKYRAWDKNNKLMFYFDEKYSHSDNEGIPCLTNKEADYFISYNDLFDVEQTTFIPLQFTGLKDKNGKEIYEGDIVEFLQMKWFSRGQEWQLYGGKDHLKDRSEISFKDAEFRIDDKYVDGRLGQINIKKRKLEIIGNIYEKAQELKDDRGDDSGKYEVTKGFDNNEN